MHTRITIDQYDELLASDFFMAPPEEQALVPIDVTLPSAEADLAVFFKTLSGSEFNIAFKKAINELEKWALDNEIKTVAVYDANGKLKEVPTKEIFNSFRNEYIDYSGDKPHLNTWYLTLYREGYPALINLLNDLKKDTTPRTQELIRHLISNLSLCAPGIAEELGAAHRKLQSQRNLSTHLMALREKIATDTTLELLKSYVYRSGDERHYCARVNEVYADQLGLSVKHDPAYQSCDQLILENITVEFADRLPKRLTLEYIFNRIMMDIDLTDFLRQLNETTYYNEKMTDFLEKIAFYGEDNTGTLIPSKLIAWTEQGLQLTFAAEYLIFYSLYKRLQYSRVINEVPFAEKSIADAKILYYPKRSLKFALVQKDDVTEPFIPYAVKLFVSNQEEEKKALIEFLTSDSVDSSGRAEMVEAALKYVVCPENTTSNEFDADALYDTILNNISSFVAFIDFWELLIFQLPIAKAIAIRETITAERLAKKIENANQIALILKTYDQDNYADFLKLLPESIDAFTKLKAVLLAMPNATSDALIRACGENWSATIETHEQLLALLTLINKEKQALLLDICKVSLLDVNLTAIINATYDDNIRLILDKHKERNEEHQPTALLSLFISSLKINKIWPFMEAIGLEQIANDLKPFPRVSKYKYIGHCLSVLPENKFSVLLEKLLDPDEVANLDIYMVMTIIDCLSPNKIFKLLSLINLQNTCKSQESIFYLTNLMNREDRLKLFKRLPTHLFEEVIYFIFQLPPEDIAEFLQYIGKPNWIDDELAKDEDTFWYQLKTMSIHAYNILSIIPSERLKQFGHSSHKLGVMLNQVNNEHISAFIKHLYGSTPPQFTSISSLFDLLKQVTDTSKFMIIIDSFGREHITNLFLKNNKQFLTLLEQNLRLAFLRSLDQSLFSKLACTDILDYLRYLPSIPPQNDACAFVNFCWGDNWLTRITLEDALIMLNRLKSNRAIISLFPAEIIGSLLDYFFSLEASEQQQESLKKLLDIITFVTLSPIDYLYKLMSGIKNGSKRIDILSLKESPLLDAFKNATSNVNDVIKLLDLFEPDEQLPFLELMQPALQLYIVNLEQLSRLVDILPSEDRMSLIKSFNKDYFYRLLKNSDLINFAQSFKDDAVDLFIWIGPDLLKQYIYTIGELVALIQLIWPPTDVGNLYYQDLLSLIDEDTLKDIFRKDFANSVIDEVFKTNIDSFIGIFISLAAEDYEKLINLLKSGLLELVFKNTESLNYIARRMDLELLYDLLSSLQREHLIPLFDAEIIKYIFAEADSEIIFDYLNLIVPAKIAQTFANDPPAFLNIASRFEKFSQIPNTATLLQADDCPNYHAKILQFFKGMKRPGRKRDFSLTVSLTHSTTFPVQNNQGAEPQRRDPWTKKQKNSDG